MNWWFITKYTAINWVYFEYIAFILRLISIDSKAHIGLNIESNLARHVSIQIPTQSPGRYTAELPLWSVSSYFHSKQIRLMCQVLTHCGFSGVSPDGNWKLRLRPSKFFTSNSRSDRRAIWFTWFSEPYDTTSLHACPSVYSTWWSQAVTHPIIDRARRCSTSVIESAPMIYRRILYINLISLQHLVKVLVIWL